MSLNGQLAGYRSSRPPDAPRAVRQTGEGNGKSNVPWGIASDPTSGDLYVTEIGYRPRAGVQRLGRLHRHLRLWRLGQRAVLGPAAGWPSSPRERSMWQTPATARLEEWAAPKKARTPDLRHSFTHPNNNEAPFREPEARCDRPEREHLGRRLGATTRSSSSTPNANTSGSSALKARETGQFKGIKRRRRQRLGRRLRHRLWQRPRAGVLPSGDTS